MAAEIREQLGTDAIGMSADVGVKDDVQAMIDRAVAEFGGLDILVNNASQLSPNVLLEQKTDEMLKRTLEIGTWGTWWAMQAALPHVDLFAPAHNLKSLAALEPYLARL